MTLPNPLGTFHAYGEDAVGNVALTILIPQTRIPATSGGGTADRGNEVQIKDIIATADRASQNTKIIVERADDNGSGAPATFATIAAIRVPDYGNVMRSYTGLLKFKAGQWLRVRYIQGIAGAVEVELTGDTAVSDINI